MKRLGKFGGATVLAVILALMMGLAGATLEAKGKNPGPSSDAICAYLAAVIEYPGVNETILRWALSLYNYFGCTTP